MSTFFLFSDECGNYAERRSRRFIERHPYYVRATVIIKAEEYQEFEKAIFELKETMGFDRSTEIKWLHLGDARNGHLPSYLSDYSLETLKGYIEAFIEKASELRSLKYIFTVTDNNTLVHAKYEQLVSWHIQNALQRVQMDLRYNGGYGVVVIDDLNDMNKKINKKCYEIMCSGDFVNYDNLKKSILVDYSHQCIGLQLADIVAGAFTNALIRESRDGNGYPFAGELYCEELTKKIRSASDAGARFKSNPFECVGYGLISIPSDNCKRILSAMDDLINQCETRRLFEE